MLLSSSDLKFPKIDSLHFSDEKFTRTSLTNNLLSDSKLHFYSNTCSTLIIHCLFRKHTGVLKCSKVLKGCRECSSVFMNDMTWQHSPVVWVGLITLKPGWQDTSMLACNTPTWLVLSTRLLLAATCLTCWYLGSMGVYYVVVYRHLVNRTSTWSNYLA